MGELILYGRRGGGREGTLGRSQEVGKTFSLCYDSYSVCKKFLSKVSFSVFTSLGIWIGKKVHKVIYICSQQYHQGSKKLHFFGLLLDMDLWTWLYQTTSFGKADTFSLHPTIPLPFLLLLLCTYSYDNQHFYTHNWPSFFRRKSSRRKRGVSGCLMTLRHWKK